MRAFVSELRLAVRSLRRRPSFTLAAILTVGIGTALNVVLFSFVDAAVLRPPPFPDAGRLYTINDPRKTTRLLSHADYEAVREQTHAFEALGAFRSGVAGQHTLALESQDRPIDGLALSPGVFQVLGTPPLVGRPLLPSDEGGDAVVVVGFRLWNELGGTGDVIGRTIRIGGKDHVVVGVMPRRFAFPSASTMFWVPLSGNGYPERSLSLVGRLRPGTSPQRAAAEVRAVAIRLDAEAPLPTGRRSFGMTSLREAGRPSDAPVFYLLQGTVALVLLIACANLSALLLARAVERRAEMALRASLGARRIHLIRAVFAESTVILAAALAASLALAFVGVHLLSRALAGSALGVLELGVDGRVLAFTGLVSALTLIGFTLVPAWRGAQADPGEVLRAGSQALTGSVRDRRVRDGLVTAQIALSLTLLIGTAAVLDTLVRSQDWEPAYEWRNLLTMDLRTGNESAGDRGTLPGLFARLGALPQVQGVAASSRLHVEGGVLSAEGAGAPATNACDCMAVTGSYFDVLRLPIVSGRGFGDADAPAHEVAVVDEVIAARLWPGGNPVGRRVKLGSPGSAQPWVTVVGIARAARIAGQQSESMGRMYVLHELGTAPRVTLFARTRTSPTSAIAPVRDAILSVDPDQPVHQLRTMESVATAALGPLRWCAAVFGIFSLITLALAAVGVYGVMAQTVASRTREIAIRRAVGASDSQILRGVLREVGWIVLAGMVAGAVGGVVISRVLPALMPGVASGEPGAWAIAITAMLGAAFLASALPVRSALRTDPSVALRTE